jgi:hypothetical protein
MSNWISNSSESEVLGLQVAHINFEETPQKVLIYTKKKLHRRQKQTYQHQNLIMKVLINLFFFLILRLSSTLFMITFEG